MSCSRSAIPTRNACSAAVVGRLAMPIRLAISRLSTAARCRRSSCMSTSDSGSDDESDPSWGSMDGRPLEPFWPRRASDRLAGTRASALLRTAAVGSRGGHSAPHRALSAALGHGRVSPALDEGRISLAISTGAGVVPRRDEQAACLSEPPTSLAAPLDASLPASLAASLAPVRRRDGGSDLTSLEP
eukprot:CAMPEP_0181177672 /NCGR_PEP_ID=MMETSP1096-20121128/5295_1 /TAXON_ID=156174 ORGANISM="Chrysochromulina ericina, Strain CCMP281" /NCGR_SAMPLE_ID=MMETSP1096 /ASSEMBLY_ACC=CAM_ASM_000453 /LENGTH=186 /DNA_ID=CAMNT_0023265857 /DNA_START=506 /DNA_END=1063 /DNA_ORIENTATION=-